MNNPYKRRICRLCVLSSTCDINSLRHKTSIASIALAVHASWGCWLRWYQMTHTHFIRALFISSISIHSSLSIHPSILQLQFNGRIWKAHAAHLFPWNRLRTSHSSPGSLNSSLSHTHTKALQAADCARWLWRVWWVCAECVSHKLGVAWGGWHSGWSRVPVGAPQPTQRPLTSPPPWDERRWEEERAEEKERGEDRMREKWEQSNFSVNTKRFLDFSSIIND